MHIYIHKKFRPPQAKYFYSLCHHRTHKINEIVNDIEKQHRRKLAAGEIFYSLCHNRTRIINEIFNETEKQDRRKLAAGENFFTAFVTIARI